MEGVLIADTSVNGFTNVNSGGGTDTIKDENFGYRFISVAS